MDPPLTESNAIQLYGATGSPYSVKIRAILRYRRTPYIWHETDLLNSPALENVRVRLLPVVQFPDGRWLNDSTEIALELERRFSTERSILPEDEALRFLALALEDFADEWGTKLMFHYRWTGSPPDPLIGRWLSFDRLGSRGRKAIEADAEQFCARQVSRMALVGCTAENAPLLEHTAGRILALLDEHVTNEAFLFGSRPSLADFAWLGQLSQIASDSGSLPLVRTRAPYLARWLMSSEDTSGVVGHWRASSEGLAETLLGLIRLGGDVYLPFLHANEAAHRQNLPSFTINVLGYSYSQASFRYQVHRLASLKDSYRALSAGARSYLHAFPEFSAYGEFLGA